MSQHGEQKVPTTVFLLRIKRHCAEFIYIQFNKITSDHVIVLRPNSQWSSTGHSSIMSMWSCCRFVTKELIQWSRNVEGIKDSILPPWKSQRCHQCKSTLEYNCSIWCYPPYPSRVRVNVVSFHVKNKIFLPVRHHKHDFWLMKICIYLQIDSANHFSHTNVFLNDTHLRKTLQSDQEGDASEHTIAEHPGEEWWKSTLQ